MNSIYELYSEIIKAALDTVYSVVTVNDFVKDATNTRKVLVLRHDLDKNIKLVEILKSTELKIL